MSYFNEIEKIEYEGKDSTNLLSFAHYNPKEIINGKSMEEHLRFGVAYWHTMCGTGADPFGAGTMIRSWNSISDPIKQSKEKAKAFFEILEKLQVPYFCFHDRDIAVEGDSLKESNKNLDDIVDLFEELMAKTGKKLLWGTANLFSNPRFTHGASTNPDPDVFAYAAAQVKKAIEVTHRLGGENYVFWGGREGYETLLNTDMKREQDNFARFLKMAAEYADKIGFKGQFLIEPKPKEPSTHQYDFDSATVHAFLLKHGLEKRVKLNIETNHATLAGHTMQHELRYARENNLLGSIDANQGDLLLGWDTDQFPTDIYGTTYAMLEVLKNGGLHSGGLNFDSKLRRGSVKPIDIFYGHIAGMDTYARGLKIASKIIEDGILDEAISTRYSGFNKGLGADIESGKIGFIELEKYILSGKKLEPQSGHQEKLENLINRYI